MSATPPDRPLDTNFNVCHDQNEHEEDSDDDYNELMKEADGMIQAFRNVASVLIQRVPQENRHELRVFMRRQCEFLEERKRHMFSLLRTKSSQLALMGANAPLAISGSGRRRAGGPGLLEVPEDRVNVISDGSEDEVVDSSTHN
ncbi:hypothetical protein JNB11_05610 [Kocuria palustris]|nr:hypothetical protein [Kocuria palustris]